jgi:DNA topoisomerase VI subunit A
LSSHPQGLLITADIADSADFTTTAKRLLIVEKDTIFHNIVAEREFLTDWELIVVTAKGFADEASIELLDFIIAHSPCEVFYVGDMDPYGLSIYFNYKKRLKDKARKFSWLGLRLSDLMIISSSRFPISNFGLQVGLSLP